MKRGGALALCLALAFAPISARAYDAPDMESWLTSFAQMLADAPVLNDPLETADPARPGEYLIECGFGTVQAAAPGDITANDLLEIEIRTDDVADCRGVRVGMGLSSALEGDDLIQAGQASLVVLNVQESGLGWSWAYVGDTGVYGVEYIAFGGAGAGMKEYTLTYVIDERETIGAIRVRVSETTPVQAEEGVRTAREMAARQTTDVLVPANDRQALAADDLRVMDAAYLGAPVAQFVAALGEPLEVQVLPGAQGRLLIYEGAALTLDFDEYTGEELVTSVSVSGTGVRGPRGLRMGQSVPEVAALFRCDEDVSGAGGLLYEALDAAIGEFRAQEAVLRYTCPMDAGKVGVLEIGFEAGAAAYWRMHIEEEEEHGG